MANAPIFGTGTTGTAPEKINSVSGGLGPLGSAFQGILTKLGGAAPNAPIKPAQVGLPSRTDFGTPGTTPTIPVPQRGDYGLDQAARDRTEDTLNQFGGVARASAAGFRNPTQTDAFRNVMSLANEQTGAAEQSAARQARDVTQRRGYAGGFEDSARATRQDRMQALATAGFAGAESVRQQEGEMFGRAAGAQAQVLDSYNQAIVEGNDAYAHDLTTSHIAQAEDALKTMSLNQEQQLAYAGSLNQAKQLQAQLNEAYNKDLIDNHRFVQMNAQIAAQLYGTLATLTEKGREFDVSTGEQQREFDTTHLDAVKRKAGLGTDAFGPGSPGMIA